MKGPDVGNCSGTVTGQIFKSGSNLRYCDGTNVFSMNTGPCSYSGSWYAVGATRDAGTCTCGTQYYQCLANGTWDLVIDGCAPPPCP